MIVHAVDAQPGAQASAYQIAYYAQEVPDAAPPARVASNAPVAVLPPQATRHGPALSFRDPAPCAIQRGYADAKGWGGVIAECDGTQVSVGGQLSAAARDTSATRDTARRVLLRTLDSDVPGVDRMVLPSALLLLLAALALYFVARSFKEEPYHG
jgi:hypothetical protein